MTWCKSNLENVRAGTKWRSQYAICRQICYQLRTNGGWEDIVVLDTATVVPHPCAALAQLCCTLVQCHSVIWHVSSAHSLVFEPNVRVNQWFQGSLTTVLPAAPLRAWALPSICLYIDLLYNTSNHAILVPHIVWRLLWARWVAGFRSLRNHWFSPSPDYSANISLIYYIADGVAKNRAVTTFLESAVKLLGAQGHLSVHTGIFCIKYLFKQCTKMGWRKAHTNIHVWMKSNNLKELEENTHKCTHWMDKKQAT